MAANYETTSMDAGPAWSGLYGVSGAAVISADASAGVACTAAPTAGQKLVITDILLSVGSTALVVDFKEETSGKVVARWYMPANSSLQMTPRGKMKLETADKKLMIDTDAAGAVATTVLYYSEA